MRRANPEQAEAKAVATHSRKKVRNMFSLRASLVKGPARHYRLVDSIVFCLFLPLSVFVVLLEWREG
jgi:hypothetical protein